MKTLYLHVGTPKTGTSAIQHFLYDNQEVLATKGICYPILPYKYQDANRYRNGHFLIGTIYDENNHIMKEAMKERLREGLEQVEHLFETFDTVLLTDESIWHALKGKSKSLIKELKQFCDEKDICLKIIVYLRRQDDFLVSSYRQWIRSGTMKKKWEEVLANPPVSFNMEYYAYLTKISSIIGKENVIVHRYERSHFRECGATIQSDFLQIFDEEITDEYILKKEIVNPSFSNNYAEMKRILNTLQAGGTKVNSPESKYFSRCMQICQDAEKEARTYFSEADRKEFMEQFNEDNDKVAKQFIDDGKSLFQTREHQVMQWHKENEAYFDDMLRFTGAALLEQKKEIDSLKGQVDQLRTQVKSRRGILRRIYTRIKRLVFGDRQGTLS